MSSGAPGFRSQVSRWLGPPHSRTKMHDLDRKSTRLNSSHLVISYAVFCLKKKKQIPDCRTSCRHSLFDLRMFDPFSSSSRHLPSAPLAPHTSVSLALPELDPMSHCLYLYP